MMKICLLVLLGSFPLITRAEYHRFYRGFALPNTNMDNFVKEVNDVFFPMFKKAHPEGLINYRPILLNEDISLGLPQEIVILTFENEDRYKAYTNTEIGKAIRAAHAPLFDSTKSASLVPVPFTGKVVAETAYLLNNAEMSDLAQDFAAVLIHSEPYGSPDSGLKAVEDIFKDSGKEKIISLVAQNYVIEYLFAKNETELEKLRLARCLKFKGTFKSNKFVALKKHKIGDKKVNFNEGMDAQW
jgi:hypothetical protein